MFDLGGGAEDYALTLAGDTDNAGNAYVTAKMMTTKWPLAAVLMEIAVQLRSRQIALDLNWIPRLQNEEADPITNLDFKSFRKENRIPTTVEELAGSFVLLPRLLEAGERILKLGEAAAKDPDPGDPADKKAVLKPRTKKRAELTPAAGKKRKRPLSQRLRVTQPW